MLNQHDKEVQGDLVLVVELSRPEQDQADPQYPMLPNFVVAWLS